MVKKDNNRGRELLPPPPSSRARGGGGGEGQKYRCVITGRRPEPSRHDAAVIFGDLTVITGVVVIARREATTGECVAY